MNQTGVLHKPTATPEQSRLAREHRARVNKLWSRPKPAKVSTGPEAPSCLEDQSVTAGEPDSIAAWAERQKLLFPPLPKKPLWFTMESDAEGDDIRRPSIRSIQRVVCRHYGVTLADLLSPRRHASIVLPRHVAIYLARKLTERSLPEIGRRFGRRDHTTALSAVRRINRMIGRDAAFAAEIAALQSDLEAFYA